MEFAALVAPGGAFWRAWVAAHWERRLKRSDYLAADVKVIAAQVVQRLGAISLRCAGCLLLGICRILRWKVIQLEDEAQEVRSGLLNSVSAGHSLPVVATLPESAVTLRPVGDVPWWVPEVEFDNSEPLQLLEAPQVPLRELRASLEEGKRHVAPLETITLGRVAPRPPPASSLAGPADAFGVPSAEEREAMDALGRQAGGQEDPPPPLDFLLGQSGGSAAFDLQMPSGDLVPSMGRSVGGLGLRGLEEDDLFPLEDPLSASPRHLVKRLEDEFNTPSGRMGFGDLGFPRLSTQSSTLARMLDFSPDARDLPTEGAAADGGVRGAAEAAAAQPPRKRRRRPKPWLDEVTEISKSRYHDTASITRQTLCDYSLHLPHKAPQLAFTTPYADLCEVLCEPFLQAKLVGERRRRAMATASASSTTPAPLAQDEGSGAAAAAASASADPPGPHDPGQSTSRGNIEGEPPGPGPDLDQPDEQGPGAGLGRGQGQGQDDLDELVPPWPGLDLHLPLPLPPSPRSDAGAPGGASPARSLASAPGSMGVGIGAGAGAEAGDPLGIGMPPQLQYSPLPPAPFSPEIDGDHEGDGDGDVEADAGMGMDPGPATGMGEVIEGLDEPTQRTEGPAEPELDVALADFPGQDSRHGAGAQEDERKGQGLALEEPPAKVRRMAEGPELEDAGATAEAGTGSRRLEECPRQLQTSLGDLDEEVSFSALCNSSQWQAEEVAQNFMGLLSLHMEGIISLSQDEPYGDIAIGRGLDWPVSATPGLRPADG